jgi:nicotinamidase-related amidase
MTSQKTALLVIDMQKDVLKKLVDSGSSVLSTIQGAVKRAREKEMPVIFIARVHRKDGVDVELFRLERFKETPFLVEGSHGSEFVEGLRPQAADYIIQKRRFSGFFQADLLLLLMRLGVSSLLLCGVQTPNCIRATAVDGLGYDFHITILEDATAAHTPEVHQANLFDMSNMGIEIKTVHAYFRGE